MTLPYEEGKEGDIEVYSLSDVTLVADDKSEYGDGTEKELVEEEDKLIKYTLPTESMSIEEARALVEDFVHEWQTDENVDKALVEQAKGCLEEKETSLTSLLSLVIDIKSEVLLIADSPYLQVRAAVDNFDDPNEPVDTFRAWFLGLHFVMFGSAINLFFTARNPSIGISAAVAQIVAYPAGKFFERTLPTRTFSLFGHLVSLNPGPFSKKEHMLITIMVGVGFGSAYATDIIFVQRVPLFFNQPLGGNLVYQILLTFSTQFIGYSVAGLTRRFLVYPHAMIWYGNLPTIVLNRSFHNAVNKPANGWKISPYRFFVVVFFSYGIYFILPDVMFASLGTFNWLTWIAPTNVKLAIITGSISGMGISPWTSFDWSTIATLVDPLVSPLNSTLNTYAGMVIIGSAMIIPIYFTNTFFTAYLPINTNRLFDNRGEAYNISRVLTSEFTLDVEKYKAYSPPYQSAANAGLFFCFFAVYTSTLTTVALYFRREIVGGLRSILRKNSAYQGRDLHARLMRQYKEVPEWWFMLVGGIAIIFGIIANEGFKTELPMWGMALGILMALIFSVPIGIIAAVANVEVTLNVLAEVIGGYALAGKPLAVMIFKAYGFVTTAQAVGYASDLKLGHYCKIPPRSMFWAQTIASVVSVSIGLYVSNWQIDNIVGLCEPNNRSKLTCPGYTTFFSSAVQWGSIGPARLYSIGSLYGPLTSGFIVGVVLPIPFYLLTRRYPGSLWRHVSVPVFLSGGLLYAPFNLSYITPAIPIAVLFQYYIFRRASAFWAKYTYILDSALGASISIFGLIYFFAFQFRGLEPDWIGNNIPYLGCDAASCPLLPIPERGFFGPSQWS